MSDPTADALKQLVVATAQEQADKGAHYLWGCAGNTPGNSDGAAYRPSHALLHANVPDLENPESDWHKTAGILKVPMLLAAYCFPSDQGDAVGRSGMACTGRAAHADLNGIPLPLAGSVGSPFSFKLKDLTDERVETLTNNLAARDMARWPRPNYNLDNNDSTRSTVWGEDCTGKRHFDCIGLVNWVLWKVLQRDFTFGIDTFANGAGGTEVPLGKAEACDIVIIGREHIGIVGYGGTAIEAKDAVSGVVSGPLNPAYWKRCFRLPASTWHVGA